MFGIYIKRKIDNFRVTKLHYINKNGKISLCISISSGAKLRDAIVPKVIKGTKGIKTPLSFFRVIAKIIPTNKAENIVI